MREPDRGEGLSRSRDKGAGAEPHPGRVRPFVRTTDLQEALRGVGPIDYEQFRADVDAILDQDSTPRFWSDS
jgi:hypothetical protein